MIKQPIGDFLVSFSINCSRIIKIYARKYCTSKYDTIPDNPYAPATSDKCYMCE